MRILMRMLAGAALIGATTLGFAAESSGESAPVTPGGCNVADYLATHSPGQQTEYGYYEYQAWIANEESQAALDGLQSLLRSHFGLAEDWGDAEALARGFIGLAADHAAETVNVVVDPTIVNVADLTSRVTAAVSDDAAKNPPAFKVAVRAGCFSAKDLAEARSVLDGLTESPLAPDDWSFYLDAHDSTYHVAISPQDADAATVITGRLGDRATIEFEGLSLTDRLNDGEPHWGGAGIRPGGWDVNICTSAFTVFLPNGNRGSVTAAHCFADTGQGEINGRHVFSGTQPYGGQTQGAFDYPSYDMVRIGNGGQSWDNKIHVDPCCPSVRTVIAALNPDMELDFICVSGMTSRSLCGLEILQRNGTFCIDGQCRVHMIKARRGGDIVARGGDSGGPMYSRSGDNNAIARGMIIGGEGGDDCNAFVPVAMCKNVWGHRAGAITSHLDVTVDIG